MREHFHKVWDKAPESYHTPQGMSEVFEISDIQPDGGYGDVYNPKVDAGYEFQSHEIGHRYELLDWTGLKDKNKKMIFEGDLVKDFYSGEIRVVQLINGCFCTEENDAFYRRHKEHEIVGSIYENPELLTSYEQ